MGISRIIRLFISFSYISLSCKFFILGEFYCKVGVLTSPRLNVPSAERLVEHSLQMKGWPTFPKTDFRRVWDNTLYVLLHVGKTHFSLVAVDVSKSELGPLK